VSFEIGLVFALVVLALIAFAVERFPIDQVAMAIPIILLVTGVIDPETALSGLSSPATVTVGAMLVLGLGLLKTGAIDAIGRWARAAPLGGIDTRVFVLCLVVAGVSPFLNNTAVVVVFLPVFLGLAQSMDTSPSRILVPLSYSAILGGTVTVLGTSTNLIVYEMARTRGLTDLTIFSIAPLGLVYLAVGLAYLFTVGRRLLPERGRAARFDVRSFMTELEVTPGSSCVDRSLGELGWGNRLGVTVLGIERRKRLISAPGARRVLRAGDRLLVMGETETLLKLAADADLASPADHEPGEEKAERPIMEVLLTPTSPLVGRTLRELRFRERYEAAVLAIEHHGIPLDRRLQDVRLEPGDILLVLGSGEALERFAGQTGVIRLGVLATPVTSRPRALVAAAIMTGVVVSAGTGLVSILVASLAGVLAMLFTGCLRVYEVYDELDWSVIFLLAGLLPLGAALEGTGGAQLVADGVADLLGGMGPTATIFVFYLLTSILTEVMSNNATAVVLTPVALLTATTLDMNPYALLVAVMFGASASFMTPVGYQTNTLVYGPGKYRFSDFVKVGAPLNLLLAVTAALLIPVFWPT